MVLSYEVKDVNIYAEKVFMRYARLKVGSRSQETFAKSISPEIDRKVLSRIEKGIGTLINEIYLNLDLQKLREIDNDEDKQDRFIRENTKFLERNCINVIFIKLIVREGDNLTQGDIEYINDLLLWETNSIYVVPILEFEGDIDKPRRVEIYDQFVKDILDMKERSVPGSLRVGLSIPSYYPRKKIENLFSLYENENKEPAFICVDFANQRISDRKRIGILPAINRHFLDESNEKYFIYGLNVRPYKRGENIPLAEDLLLVECGFNAFGPVHGKKGVRRFFPARTCWDHYPKLFWKMDYLYYPLSDDEKRKQWLTWRSELYDTDIEDDFKKASKGAAITIKRFNHLALNEELKELADGVRSGDSDLINQKLENKRIPDTVARGIMNILNKEGGAAADH